MTRFVPQSWYFPTQVPMLRTQTPMSSPEVKRALLGLWGKRSPQEEWAAPPPAIMELSEPEKEQRALEEVSEFSTHTCCACGKVSPLWDSWGIPAQNGPAECPVPVGKSDTVALRAHGPRGVYPYIFIISNFIIK